MATQKSDGRHYKSTGMRNKAVMELYQNILCELGKYASLVPRSYIYGLLQERTGLSFRTLSRIINRS